MIFCKDQLTPKGTVGVSYVPVRDETLQNNPKPLNPKLSTLNPPRLQWTAHGSEDPSARSAGNGWGVYQYSEKGRI